jgi:hypothetical protein
MDAESAARRTLPKETAVIFWKVKQGLVIAAVIVLGLVGACENIHDHARGFYW